jgi:hypothetical protein
MKQLPLPYQITKPPRAIRNARAFDNISLVPASLLLEEKDKYQTITNNLPKGSVLICEAPQKPRISRILSRVATFLQEKGHIVRILPYSLLV